LNLPRMFEGGGWAKISDRIEIYRKVT